MIRRIDLRGSTPADYRDVVPRADVDVDAAIETVRPICEAVRTRGAEAIRELSLRFDGVAPDELRVPQSVLDRALEQLDPDVREALEVAVARIPGVESIAGVSIFGEANGDWRRITAPAGQAAELRIERWQLPELLAVVLSPDGVVPGDLRAVPNPFAAKKSFAVPVVPEVC